MEKEVTALPALQADALIQAPDPAQRPGGRVQSVDWLALGQQDQLAHLGVTLQAPLQPDARDLTLSMDGVQLRQLWPLLLQALSALHAQPAVGVDLTQPLPFKVREWQLYRTSDAGHWLLQMTVADDVGMRFALERSEAVALARAILGAEVAQGQAASATVVE